MFLQIFSYKYDPNNSENTYIFSPSRVKVLNMDCNSERNFLTFLKAQKSDASRLAVAKDVFGVLEETEKPIVVKFLTLLAEEEARPQAAKQTKTVSKHSCIKSLL